MRGTKFSSLQYNEYPHHDLLPDVASITTSTKRLHRKPPPDEVLAEEPTSPLHQLHRLSGESYGSGDQNSGRKAQQGLTDIIGTLEQEIGNMMGSLEHMGSQHRPETLRLVSAEPVHPLEVQRQRVPGEFGEVSEEFVEAPETPYNDAHNGDSDELTLPEKLDADLETPDMRKLLSPLPGASKEIRYSPIFLSPLKDITQGPLLPAYGFGRRSMLFNKEPRDSLLPTNGLGSTVTESSPLKSIISHESGKLPQSDDFAFANNEEQGFVLAEESESAYNSQASPQQAYFGSGDALSDNYSANQKISTASRESLAAQVLPDSVRHMKPTKSRETDASARSDPLTDLSAFFKPENLASAASAGSRTNLGGIPENAGASTTQEFSAPGYPLNDAAIELQLNFTFGAPSPAINPRSPLKQTPTFNSTDSGMSRTWSNSALLQNFHARMLLTSSITSSGSNRHVNLATLKRSFSLRPGEGERSNYVQTIRRNAGTAYNDAGPVKWKLPTGILPIDKKSLYLQTSSKFNRGGAGPRGKKTSGVELKHGHLQARLLASEVDDTEDSNKFGALGRSSTNSAVATKPITPVTSKSSSTSAALISRQSSLNRSNTLASNSTDAQSVGTRDLSSKLSRMDSEVLSLNSEGSVAEYQFGDGYYQHPGYKFEDEEEGDTERFSPVTDEGTLDRDYDDDMEDEDEDKPRLFLANPDSSSDEN